MVNFKRIHAVVLGVLIMGIGAIQAAQQPGTWVNVLPASEIPSASGSCYASTISIDPARPSDAYVYSDEQGCWRSTDYGVTWKKVSAKGGPNGTGISGHGAWYASIDKNPNRDPSTPPDLYVAAGYAENGIWKSTDWGVTWFDVWKDNLYAGDGVTNIYSDVGRDVMAILNVDPDDKNHLIASPHSYWGTGGNNGVFETTDGGGKWIIRKSTYFSFAPHADMLFSLDKDTWCVSHNYGIVRTTDAGRTWGPTAGSVSGSAGIQYCNRKVGNTWYIATDHTGSISKTTDMGATWSSIGLTVNKTDWILASATKLYVGNGENSNPLEVYEASVSNDAAWTKQTGTPTSCGHDADITFDGNNYIILFPGHISGVWRYVEPSGKPYVQLSTSAIEADFTVGSAKSPKTIVVTVTNPIRAVPYGSAVTVTKKAAWLTVSLNSAKTDSQVITNTIDPLSFSDVEAKYYDTVTVHAPGAEIVDMTYQVFVWVRQAAVLTSIAVTPGTSSMAAGQVVQFSAAARDQYGLNLGTQPSFTWSATAGNMDGKGLLTATGCPGTYSVSATSTGITGIASITISTANSARVAIAATSSNEAGHTAQAMIDGVVKGYPEDGSREWSSNGEKAGAWAQLTWSSPVTVDSIALWDRPNSGDQVTAGTLTFSDGSSITVGTLPNDASTPWSQKFAAKTITWVKFTVTSASSSTQNAGLAECELFNTTTCSTGFTQHAAARASAVTPSILTVDRGGSVGAPEGTRWELDLFALNGTLAKRFFGQGSKLVSFVNSSRGFTIARLRTSAGEIRQVLRPAQK